MSAQAFRPRILHAMLRVADLERSIGFWCGALGMRELRRIEFPTHVLVFLGFGTSPEEAQIELWHDREPAAAGSAPPAGAAPARSNAADAHAPRFHVGIGVERIDECVAHLKTLGVEVRRDPAPMRAGGRVIALLVDPDGHEVELLG